MIHQATQLRNALIVGLLIFTPWAFASLHTVTQIIANSAATLLGLLYALSKFSKPTSPPNWRDILLTGLTIVLLLYGLFSACFISIDPHQSAFTMWTYAGLAGLFWSTRDWLDEDPAARQKLLSIILSNAALIGLIAILQRLGGTEKVLWIYKPAVTSRFYTFGPFEYRATAAQFFNLLWPVALGFYLQARRSWLLWIVGILGACPLITSSRGGLLLMLAAAVTMLIILKLRGAFSQISTGRLLLLATAILILFGLFGSTPLQKRWRESRSLAKFLDLGKRRDQNQNSWRIIADHPWLGIGPGAYEPTFRAYNFPNAFQNPNDHDPAHQVTYDFFYAKAHNDWLQTLAEWGAPAALLLLTGLIFCFANPARDFINLGIFIGALTLLAHATFDYPLQNLAILTHFSVLLAINASVRARHLFENELPEEV